MAPTYLPLVQPWNDVRCGSCHACCRTTRVPPTRADLRRMKSAGVVVADSVEWVPAEELGEVIERASIWELREGPAALFLRLTPDEAGAECTFLAPHGCRIYDHRPRTCALFPFAPSSAGDEYQPSFCEAPVWVEGPREPVATIALELQRDLEELWSCIALWNRGQRHRRRLRHRLLGREAALTYLTT